MFLGHKQKLIKVDICDEANTLKHSNQAALHTLDPTITFLDLLMLLRMFSFYALCIPFFEVWVLPCHSLIKQGYGEGAGGAVQSYIICGIWNNKDSILLENIKKEAVADPILAHTNFSGRM